MHLLALDWRKAFDSINPDGLLLALRRFGLPEHFLTLVRAIYRDRVFHVSDSGVTSTEHAQFAGICQGCPLSPFLFVAVMTVLMKDAYEALGERASLAAVADSSRIGFLFDLLYADDTSIIGSQAADVEELARAVESSGKQYGMTLHWGKTQLLSVRSSKRVRAPDGSLLDERPSILYLGALISADGKPDSEISRRIGLASAEFRLLKQLWNHANVTKDQKLTFFNSFVVSKLSYALCTMGLTRAQLRRLDGFHARCLRRIMAIPAAYISRISNNTVRERANVQPLSATIAKAQMMLLGRVGRSDSGSALRRDTLVGGTATPLIGAYVRRVGRPRQDWTTQAMAHARSHFASAAEFERCLLDKSKSSVTKWRAAFC